MGFFEEVAESIKEWGEKPQPMSYKAVGKVITCTHCTLTVFTKHRVVTRGPLTYALVCTNCSAVRWFADAPAPVQ